MRQVQRFAYRYQNPLLRRRYGDSLILLSAILAGVASRWAGTWLWIVAIIPLIAGICLEAKTSDGLLTMRYPGTRRRSLGLAMGGLMLVLIGIFAGSALPTGAPAALSIGGIGFFLAGAAAIVWHHAATYAGGRIIHLSDEDF
jgi:hypothetical protein